MEPSSAMKRAGDTFLYFAYGSNLLSSRIHINNPTAVVHKVAKLKDHILDFGHAGNRWRGAVATIRPQIGSDVWGVVWKLSFTDLPCLDNQEGVHKGIYQPLEVELETASGEGIIARTYKMLVKDQGQDQDNRPSAVYKQVILQGARENGLPDDYVAWLEKIEDNGYDGSVEVNIEL